MYSSAMSFSCFMQTQDSTDPNVMKAEDPAVCAKDVEWTKVLELITIYNGFSVSMASEKD